VTFTLVHAGKYRRQIEDRQNSTQTKHNPEKANNTKHSKTKLAWFSRLIRHSARKRGGLGLFYNAAEPTRGVLNTNKTKKITKT